MFDFHSDTDTYFRMQHRTSEEYIIPFIKEVYAIPAGARVMEFGCGEAGVLSAFLKIGSTAIGIDIDERKLDYGRQNMADKIESGELQLINQDIYRINPEKNLGGKFDLIILKDVIEHISNQQKLMTHLKTFLKPKGLIFLGFPPWQMPFGGHQQMCRNRFLARLPYFHLLPMPVYRAILKASGDEGDLCAIKECGISIERFERIAKQAGFETVNCRFYWINPIYKYKFNLKTRKTPAWIAKIPYLRNFVTTSVYYLLQTKNE